MDYPSYFDYGTTDLDEIFFLDGEDEYDDHSQTNEGEEETETEEDELLSHHHHHQEKGITEEDLKMREKIAEGIEEHLNWGEGSGNYEYQVFNLGDEEGGSMFSEHDHNSNNNLGSLTNSLEDSGDDEDNEAVNKDTEVEPQVMSVKESSSSSSFSAEEEENNKLEEIFG